MSHIDVHQHDRGLRACLAGAQLKPEWIDAYVKYHSISTLDDFVYLIRGSDWESSVGEHVGAVRELKDEKIALARFKSAFEVGQQALKQAAQPVHKAEDLDEALPESTMQQLNSDWGKRYNLTFDSVLEPSEQLRARIYREWKKQTMTVIEAKRIKSPAVQPLAEISDVKAVKRPAVESETQAPWERKRQVKGDTWKTVTLEAEASALATQLHSAKPVTWRGRGDLPQVTWANPWHGTWLVLDLWSGLGGLPMTLLQLGVHSYGVAAECDEVAVQVARTNMPHLVHVAYVEDLCAADFTLILRRRNFRGVLIGGGSPCQGNSWLNKQRRGLDDDRSLQPQHLQRLRDELHQIPEAAPLEVVLFLENVGSMPASVQARYSSWLGAEPIMLDSACCGWLRRRRLYWLVGSKGGITSATPPPTSWAWSMSSTGQVPTLVFGGDKPLPPRCLFQQGLLPKFEAKDVVKAGDLPSPPGLSLACAAGLYWLVSPAWFGYLRTRASSFASR
eukprot:Skav207971  [mRNA]  locus=scaffold495:41021:43631:+ [translate_table: standard]